MADRLGVLDQIIDALPQIPVEGEGGDQRADRDPRAGRTGFDLGDDGDSKALVTIAKVSSRARSAAWRSLAAAGSMSPGSSVRVYRAYGSAITIMIAVFVAPLRA